MCPFCFATMGRWIFAGAVSTGGLVALAEANPRKNRAGVALAELKRKGRIKMSTNTIDNPKIVSREGRFAARKKLLAKEKKLTRERDAVAAERRQLPWVKVEKNYVFDSPGGKKTLADLFDGKSQLIVYHFMFGPDWKERLPQSLVQHGSYGWRAGPSGATRRLIRGGFTSPFVQNRAL